MSIVRQASVVALWAAASWVSTACVARLSDPNEPTADGAITGPSADCSAPGAGAPGLGAPTGPPEVRLTGRIDRRDEALPKLSWPGDEITARFRGTHVYLTLDVAAPLPFTVVLDDGAPQRILAIPEQRRYTLAEGLDPAREHSVVIHRDAEELLSGPATFGGLEFGADAELLPSLVRPRRIEVLGDSITCGYGILGPNAQACSLEAATTSNYLAYASETARRLDAELTTVCFSGKGVYRNFRSLTPEEVAAGQNDDLLPAIYERLAPADRETPWDFASAPQPDVVVVNAGTNDFLNVETPVDADAFRVAYTALIERIRKLRPNAHILCALSPMISNNFVAGNPRDVAREAIRATVAKFEAAGDARVYFMELNDQGFRRGMGCDYHPNLATHRIMADQLTAAIRQKTCW